MVSTVRCLGEVLRSGIRVTRTNEARRGDFIEAVRQEHHAIVSAIESGDAEAARAAVRRHTGHAASRLRDADEGFWNQTGASTWISTPLPDDTAAGPERVPGRCTTGPAPARPRPGRFGRCGVGRRAPAAEVDGCGRPSREHRRAARPAGRRTLSQPSPPADPLGWPTGPPRFGGRWTGQPHSRGLGTGWRDAPPFGGPTNPHGYEVLTMTLPIRRGGTAEEERT
ncbi:FCD domain-containing protein [Streptomyces sp. ISL-10]|uniref:FCD domain-containing protein n=1 Tax=Streptomyces sp. ISL-10 TaxID=2819172 RepID=UPI002035CCD4|nr:FCD domain-containing protein [Streptomyces sp. ISL-10]